MMIVRKTKFVAQFDGNLQGSMNASHLYDILRMSFEDKLNILLKIGFSCRCMDWYLCRVVAIYDNGSFAVYCKARDRYINISPLDVVGASIEIIA